MAQTRKHIKRFVSDGNSYRVTLSNSFVVLYQRGSKQPLGGKLHVEGKSILSEGKELLENYKRVNSSKTIEEMFG